MASPSISDVSNAQGLLGPALGILDIFNHRNKNQHRLSQWWSQFDMLRRGLRKLIVDLEASVDAETKAAASATKKKKGKKGVAQKERDDAVRNKMEVRARHVHEQLVPRAFLAFTQLAADNQYAHLGLALIGVLAQVNAAIAPLVSPSVQESLGAITAEQVTTSPVAPGRDPEEAGADLGVAVSRTELVNRKRLAAEDDPSTAPERNNAKQKGEDTEEDAQKTGTSDGAEVKEKSRKKKRRDEFDDIFGSLETEESSKKKKKKKSKKRDEFDDIFGSLI